MSKADKQNPQFSDEQLEQYLLQQGSAAFAQELEAALKEDAELQGRLDVLEEELAVFKQELLEKDSGACSEDDMLQLSLYLDDGLSEAERVALEERLAKESPLRAALVTLYQDLQILLDDGLAVPEFIAPKAGEFVDYKAMREALLQRSARKQAEEEKLRKLLEDSQGGDALQQGSS